LKRSQHKLEKIQRALVKAENEGNKSNMKKCKKFIGKYEQKIEAFKKKARLAAAKILAFKAKQAELALKKNPSKSDVSGLDSKGNRYLSPSSTDSPRRDEQLTAVAASKQLPQPEVKIKLPYPIINDTRDLTTILGTLDSKSIEIMKRREAVKNSIEQYMREVDTHKRAPSDYHERLDKMNQLIFVYDSQQEKLVQQIEYAKLSLNLDALRANSSTNIHLMMSNAPLIDKMSQQLNEMFNYMKSENTKKVRDSKLINEAKINEQMLNVSTTMSCSPKSAAAAAKPISPKEKINTMVSIVNNSLATLLAHTAASAHSTAALTAYAYNYYQYYNQQNPDNQISLEMPKVETSVVPLKTEIEKASDTFAKYRDKISSFFTSSKKIEEESANRAKQLDDLPKTSGLNRLVAAYGGSNNEDGECSSSESDNDDDNAKKIQPASKPTAHEVIATISLDSVKDGKQEAVVANTLENESDDESVGEVDDDDYLLNDLDADCELEIVTTSELRANPFERNYLLPSLKASYFPLKASLESEQINLSENLIVSEKSKFGVTLLGSGYKRTNRSLSDILYG
jgi:hypothetical protein